MQNGLYKASFSTPFGSGDGVVYMRDGQLWGGDSMMFYRGTYTVSGNKLSAEVKSEVHSKTPGMVSVFGADRVAITAVGAHTGTQATLSGTAPQAPGVTLLVKLNKLTD